MRNKTTSEKLRRMILAYPWGWIQGKAVEQLNTKVNSSQQSHWVIALELLHEFSLRSLILDNHPTTKAFLSHYFPLYTSVRSTPLNIYNNANTR